ncbi:MAG: hypothetical protein M1828_000862 [Chrysothrix sp. TS-e1954]|nr:MAG: hypothetical protein M1828_000862 [Chrysothrix sp. TS-e1954]
MALSILVVVILCFYLGLQTNAVNHVLHEKRAHLPSSWVRRGRVPLTSTVSVRVGLASQNLEDAEAHLLDVSDPQSSNYGRHWTSEEVIERFQPSDDTVKAVEDWLVEHGNVDRERVTQSDNKAWLALDASAAEVETLLKTELFEHEHISGHVLPACDAYHVAEHVSAHIDYITPGIQLPMHIAGRVGSGVVRRAASALTQAAPCFETVSPACIKRLYNVPASPGKAHPGNEMGILEDDSYYVQADLNQFFTGFNTDIPNDTHPDVDSIDGGQARVAQGEQNTPEATLDIEVAYPLLYPQNIRLLQTNDKHYGKVEGLPNTTIPDGFNNLLDALDGSYCTYKAFGEKGNDPNIDPVYPDPASGAGSYRGKLQCGVFTPPNVISISLAGQEADVPAAYQKRQCNEFMKLGLQGVSVIVPSGDTGIRAYPPADGDTGCLGPRKNIFSPMWPSTCPYVTVVGGTMIAQNDTVEDAEHVLSVPGASFSSGGGFSNLFPRPSYQDSVIKHYFRYHDPPFKHYNHIFNDTSAVRSGRDVASTGGVYSRLGRGVPDVAAVGFNIGIVLQGQQSNGGAGTSASAPLFAALVNRINEARLAKNKSPVGFINPVLYNNADVLNDITLGQNNGCGSSDDGFKAVEGWDPVTGLGTPNFEKLRDILLSVA